MKRTTARATTPPLSLRFNKIVAGGSLIAAVLTIWGAVGLRSASAQIIQTQVINVQMDSGGGLYSGTAAAPDTGTVWNALWTGADSGLIPDGTQAIANTANSTGQLTGIGFTLSYINGLQVFAQGDGSPDALLSQQFWFNSGGSPHTTAAFSNLPAGATCDLYVYGMTHGANNSVNMNAGTTNVIMNGSPNGNSTNGLYGTDNQGWIWNVVTNLTPDTNGILTATINAPYGWSGVNGFQLVVTSVEYTNVLASFSATPTTGGAPLSVTFTDTSTGTISNRCWSFGDGATTNTTVTSLLHTYPYPGTNTVSLIVSGDSGVSTNTQTDLVVATSVDTLGDGIPDWWRAQYFPNVDPTGTTTNGRSCAGCDAAGSGQHNLLKYVAGLDPTNPAAVFLLQVVGQPGQTQWQNLLFSPEVAGRTYTPFFSTNLVSGGWLPLTDYTGPVTNGSQVTITDTNATPPHKFYRIGITYP